MSFDIYGEHLRSGHCEVHPYVHEEYPCSVCISESQEKRRYEIEYERYCREEAEEYYRQMAIDMLEGTGGEGI